MILVHLLLRALSTAPLVSKKGMQNHALNLPLTDWFDQSSTDAYGNWLTLSFDIELHHFTTSTELIGYSGKIIPPTRQVVAFYQCFHGLHACSVVGPPVRVIGHLFVIRAGSAGAVCSFRRLGV